MRLPEPLLHLLRLLQHLRPLHLEGVLREHSYLCTRKASKLSTSRRLAHFWASTRIPFSCGRELVFRLASRMALREACASRITLPKPVGRRHRDFVCVRERESARERERERERESV
jgi:hypothetical protein